MESARGGSEDACATSHGIARAGHGATKRGFRARNPHVERHPFCRRSPGDLLYLHASPKEGEAVSYPLVTPAATR
ncbi:Hypothetical protein A7982_09739 [Minicystis rosea]|nr:Hypothetical protein A7982_09739 [Minicystis rosea]